jgi:hypothetical protein
MKTSFGLAERYDKGICGVLGCFDRLVVTGTLTEIAHPEAMGGKAPGPVPESRSFRQKTEV